MCFKRFFEVLKKRLSNFQLSFENICQIISKEMLFCKKKHKNLCEQKRGALPPFFRYSALSLAGSGRGGAEPNRSLHNYFSTIFPYNTNTNKCQDYQKK